MTGLPPLNLRYVETVQDAEAFLRWLSERRPVLAVDTETTGVGWADTLRLVQFGDGQGGWALSHRDWRGVIAEGLRRVRDSEVPVAMHHAQFDQHKLEQDDLPVPLWSNLHDTMILARLKNPNLSAGLKQMCGREFGQEAVAGQSLLKQEMHDNRWTWATVPTDLPSYWGYGVVDTCLTALAFERLLPAVPAAVYEREMAVLSVMYGAEKRGMRVDVPYTEALLQDWTEEASVLRAALQEQGIENPGSDVQVTAHLKSAGWEPEEFTDTGLPKLDKDVLDALTPRYGDVAVPLLRYRRLRKWTSAFLARFLSDRDENDLLHADIQTLGARTGRMSIRNPALQTLPSKESSIRNAIIPSDGRVLCAIDYKQMEPRLTASYSGDQGLIGAFLNDEDLYTYCAEQVYGEGNGDEHRSVFKAVMLARTYGAGPAKMAATAKVSEAEIQGVIDGLDRRFPDLAAFFESVQHAAKVRLASEGEPYITTSGGRRVVGEADKIYAMVNALIQGSSADVFKAGIVALDSRGLGDYIVCPVHDELLFDFPKENAEEMAREAQECMEDHTQFAVPLVCSVHNHLDRWGSEDK